MTTGALLAGTAGPAFAACSNTGSFPSITAFNCTGSDTNGHSIGTFVFGVPVSGNSSDITSSMDPGASISNAAGSPALSVVMRSGADWNFSALDPFNQIQSVNANALQFGATSSGSVITHDFAGQITALSGNAVYGNMLRSSTVSLTYESTAMITATGSGHLLGIPSSGAGVVLLNGTGSVDWTVTNHGQFRTENDSIAMINLLGSGTHAINNDGTIGTSVLPAGGAGAYIFAPNSNSTGTITNNGAVYATGNGYLGDYGGLAVVTGGNATIYNNGIEGAGGYVQTVYDPGLLAVSVGGGNALVDGQYGTVISTNGVGIAAIALGNGSATITAGETTAGGDALSLAGFTLPPVSIPGIGSLALSGGLLAIAGGSGNASATAYGDVHVNGGTFGVTAISLGGAATTTLNGVTIDPPVIGSSAIVLGGTSDANVTATDSTIYATGIGALGLNLGTGQTIVSLTNTAIGDGTIGNTPTTGVLALSTSGALNVSAVTSTIQATDIGVLALKFGPGTTTVDGTNHVVVSNDNTGGTFGTSGVINVPNGAGVTVLAFDPTFTTPNNVLVANTNAAQIIGAGGLLTGAVNVYADGNVVVNNLHDSQLTNTLGTTGLAVGVLAGGNASLTNDRRSDITGNVVMASLGGSASIVNDRGSTWSFEGISGLAAIQDATILNDRGGQITGTNALLALVAGNDAKITNDRGGSLDLSGISTNLMIAGHDASIVNLRGGSFSMTGVSANVMFAAHDATISNERGGSFTIAGLSGANVMMAGNDATISNDHRGSFTMSDLLNANVMIATNNVSISNDRGSSFTLTNFLGSNLMTAQNGDATISNDRGSLFSVSGITGQFISAGQDATITNQRGAQFNLTGLTGTFMTAGRDATLTNARGGNFTLTGTNVLTMNAGRDATIDNKTGGSIVLDGVNTIALNANLALGGGSATINNSTGAQIVTYGVANFLLSGSEINNSSNGGDNNQVCTSLPGICVNGLATFSGTGGSQLEFNNAGGLLSMINGWSGFGTGGTTTGYGTYIGDVTVINGNFNASGNSQLAIDARLGGPGLDSASDLLLITNLNNTGAVTGSTGIIIANGNNPGQYNPVGIPVVAVASGSTLPSDFYIDPQSNYYKTINGIGVVDKGLFFYGLTTKPNPEVLGGIDHVLVGLPDQEAFQLTYAVTGAQNIWYDTAVGWLDRQGDLRHFVDLGLRGRKSPGDDGADMPAKAAPPIFAGPGYGAWIKATGNWANYSAQREVPGFSQYSFNTGFKQNTYSIVGGIDGGRDGVLHAGDTFVGSVMGGYVSSDLRFKQSPNKFTYSGGTFGVSGSYMSNGWFADGLFKADFLRLSIDMPSIVPFGPSTDTADVTNVGGMGSIGYRFDRGDFYLEPALTLAYLRTSIDKIGLQTIGVNWSDTTSFRGALGARFGGRTIMGNYLVDAFITGRVWDEWEGSNPVTFLSTGPALELSGGTPKGVFGEVSGMINLASMTSGWSGFVGGGVKFNDNFTSAAAKTGAHYQW